MEEVRTVLATLIPIIPTYTVFIARLIHGGVNTLDVREGPQHESRLCDHAHAVAGECFQLCVLVIETVEGLPERALVTVVANFTSHVEAVCYEVLPWGGNARDVRTFSGADLCHHTVRELQRERLHAGDIGSLVALTWVMVQVCQIPNQTNSISIE